MLLPALQMHLMEQGLTDAILSLAMQPKTSCLAELGNVI